MYGIKKSLAKSRVVTAYLIRSPELETSTDFIRKWVYKVYNYRDVPTRNFSTTTNI